MWKRFLIFRKSAFSFYFSYDILIHIRKGRTGTIYKTSKIYKKTAQITTFSVQADITYKCMKGVQNGTDKHIIANADR